ncbi:L,D-transpeptidase family protein [Solirubrobacter sp. CPCC 204708]|uniref:L,D-transpeptidase family protein n=1 Tax=Solirubrobacter deserti TaxID=2282478 RepID=A0ABT4RC01_9ACTN|nr:L,D-transpeptidase family protein [Solirubrobacter deserti]MBE2317051.1 L,D-transpeptidase family protein [Solirubrobacter deserti]MDA0136057.1 L,D-transpeptidase family protein [Solirubrobacter deserti]
MKRTGLALVALGAVPATASAQTPPAPAPVPATATLSVTAQDTLGGAALTGRSFTARVVMKPYVPNETAVLRVYRGKKKIRVKTLAFKPVNGGAAGVATLKVKSAKAGRLSLRASHRATPALATAVAKTVRLDAVRPYAARGSRGAAVRILQSRLAAMKYVVPRTGVYDSGTANAVMAWRKMTGMARTYTATSDVFSGLLAGKGKFKVRHPGDGRHVEARISKQVFALIDGGKVQRIYHTSTGAPATPTVRGKFRVYRKDPGTNAKGMVDSVYFIRGYAIHGYVSVPPYNASHGCLRVPIPNAREIYNWLQLGNVVWVEE